MNIIKQMPATDDISAARDVGRAVAALTLAFADDPVTRWLYPDAAQHLALFPGFARGFGGNAFAHGTARMTGDHAGVALWLPPGVEPDHAAIAATLPAEREAETSAIFEQLMSYHPSEPYWYLPLLGVDPAFQRQGRGAALLEERLRRCDSDHVAAHLESTNPANIPLYQRHGFKLLGTVQVGSVPPLFPMFRAAR
jgi:ribosomal protein S18 acetylase RimI-like enzyme